MPKIFISYRRDDSAYPAQYIYKALRDHFGPEGVVFDVDDIPLGVDFRQFLNDAVGQCDVLLAVIGDSWNRFIDERRNASDDYVCIEIQAALERGIPVVPVLVGRATIPGENNLPTELVDLAFRQAAEVRAGRDFEAHLKNLVGGLDHLLSGRTHGEEKDKANGRERPADAQGEPEPFPEMISNSLGMEFIYVPPGTFTMGSFSGESGRIDDERQHEATLTQGFYMQTTPATQGQWYTVMGSNPSAFEGCGEDCPVDSVSWDDVQGFIKKMNSKETSRRYRLPTEAEWEYVCRAGTTTAFSFGNDAEKFPDYGWYNVNALKRTHPVGRKTPNLWGLHDMHGNVWEWCQDWYDDYPYQKAIDPAGPPRGSKRVLRGGSWLAYAGLCRSAVRRGDDTGIRRDVIGFRLVCLPDQ